MRATSQRKVLVLGGTGAVGAAVAELATGLGHRVTVTGRRERPVSMPLGAVRHIALDLLAESARSALDVLLRVHDLVVVACEPWTYEGDPARLVGAFDQLYGLALKHGFEVAGNRARLERGQPPRRLVRVGSCAAELPHRLIDGVEGWPEDAVDADALTALAHRDPMRDHSYFEIRVALVRCAEIACASGLDLVHALPAYVLSPFGDRGDQEPLEQARKSARRTGLIPSVPINVVPYDVAARALLALGEVGAAGERYQITGVEMDTCTLHGLSLRHEGLHPRPFPVPREELVDEWRLLSGQGRGNPIADLMMMPWDLARRLVLERSSVSAWHLAVLLEGADRGDGKLRELMRAHPELAEGVRLPERREMMGLVDRAAVRKASRNRPWS